MKKRFFVWMAGIVLILSFVGCTMEGKSSAENTEFEPSEGITLIMREEGSGTGISFLQNLSIVKDALKSEDFIVAQSTEVMLEAVESDNYAIGYVSLGSLNDSVKAICLEGVLPTKENVANKSYGMVRDFYIVTKEEQPEPVKDFIGFIFSSEGKAIIEKEGYISSENVAEFKDAKPAGKIAVSGSTSITPLMEKLMEGYKQKNPNVEFEINETDSTSGINAVADDIADLAMTSRKMTTKEKLNKLKGASFASDGIAVIVNKNNPVENMTTEEVKNTYTGDIVSWKELLK